ncbi:MAG: 4-phosphoerythronate dehydrogenase [Gammaproteobacteria bacterium]|nr:MAG: 4-phosphoerythronate dehydrogenase [Gammaproteobacteria bacterium]
MKIFFDENMPYAAQFFADFGADAVELVPFAGRELTPEQVADAEVLLVRSITQVNEELLALNNKLIFVGTATIGVDHIDQTYLASRNIAFSSAPGCNAVAVAEYVLSALVVLAERYLLDLSTLTVGIIGAGNTGTQFTKKLDALSINYKLYDPPLEQAGDPRKFSSFEQILSCDVISLHVPLVQGGEHATYHLLNEQILSQLNDKQILINACRGEVVDNKALLKIKQQGHQLKIVWDVWENEPNILTDLIAYTEIATAHIAGYSLEGKSAGTEQLYQALCQHLDVQPSKQLKGFLPPAAISQVTLQQAFDQTQLTKLVTLVYDVRRDDGLFRENILSNNQLNNLCKKASLAQKLAQSFDAIRKNYPTRREFSSLRVTLHDTILTTANVDVPHQLGFTKPIN